MTINELANATEIFDGQRWYYSIERGSITVDEANVTFIVRWGRDRKRLRITLALAQVRGVVAAA